MDSVRLGLLSNCRAGLNGGSLSALEPLLQAAPEVVHVTTQSSTQVPGALSELARQGVNIVAVNGGDGTLQHVLTHILDSTIFPSVPAIAPLAGGRTNMNAADIGSARKPATGFAALLRAVQTHTLAQRIVKRPVLRVDCGPAQRAQYGMFFGVGVIQRALSYKHQLYPKRRLQGLFGAGLFLGAALLQVARGSEGKIFTPDQICLTLDEKEALGVQRKRESFQLVMATTLKRLLLRICPFWGTEEAPLRMTAIAAHATRSPIAAWKVLRGLQPPQFALDSGYRSHNVEQLNLHMDCGYTIDGELFAAAHNQTLSLSTDRRINFIRA